MDARSSPSRLSSLVSRLMTVRAPASADDAERRRLALLQFSAWFGVVNMLAFSGLYALADARALLPPLVLSLACVPLYALVAALNRHGKALAAKLLMNAVLGGSMFVSTWFLVGRAPGLHFFFLLASLFPLMLWRLRDFPFILAFMAANLAGFVAVEYRADESGILVGRFPPEWLGFFNGMAAVAVFAIVAVLLVYFQLHAEKDARALDDRARSLEELMLKYEALARTDPLTGLYNRRAMRLALEEETARMTRNRGGYSILLVDIDRFKEVNDTYGHEAGDATLVELSRLFVASLREVDLVARWGGEEFLVLLPDTGSEGAMVVAEKLRAAVAAHRFRLGDAESSCTVTVGVAFHERISIPVEDTIRRADDALYRGKEGGRDRVVLSE